jgi:hypothetical protein
MISRERRDRIKSMLIRSPALFRAVRGSYLAYAGVQRELAALFHFAPHLIIKKLRSEDGTAWQRALPVQQPSQVDAASVTPTLNSQQIKAWCNARRLDFTERADAIYLPPDTWRATPLALVMPDYPADAGLKVIKLAGGIDENVNYPHPLQALTFNFLHLQGIAPRLYDLVQIRDGSGVNWTAYVAEHVVPVPLLPLDGEEIISRLRKLESSGALKLTGGADWNSSEFQPPECNGNLLRDMRGHTRYVGVQNFMLQEYDAHLRLLAEMVTPSSHFGAPNRLLGGKGGSFLYQEIPGLDRPAKRSPRARLQAWDPLLERAHVSIERKVVFDFGCNLGLMGAEYLRRGVRWMHGWDRPEVVEAARKVLLSIGCTRFSLTGGALDHNSDLAAAVPAHLRSVDNDGAIVSYLSVRGHFGWLHGLSALPWRYMLYEGHSEDRQIETYITDLNAQIPVRLLTTDRVSDGVGGTRDIAIIERLPR